MAEHDRRSYRSRDLLAPRNSEASARVQPDDPLADLARLIGQRGPMNDRDGDDPADSVRPLDARNAGARHSAREAAREPLRATRPPAAPPAPNMNASRDVGYAKAHAYRDTGESHVFPSEPQIFPSRSADGRHQDDRRYDDESRHQDDSRYGTDGSYQDDSRYDHDGTRSEGTSDYDYGDDGHDYSNDHAYADDAGYAAEDYEDEAPSGGKRGAFILVATVFILAVLGTAGAFGYRAIFGDSMLPSLPPIIKAEGGPNKIVPTAPGAQGKSFGQADVNSGDSDEKLVSREEQPVNIPPPAAETTPRIVSTVPVFPDSAANIGPGSAVTGYPIGPMASAGPGAFPPANPVGTAPTTVAPNSAPTPALAAPTAAPGPAAAAPAPATPSAAKKIHTVAIRSDQSDAGDMTSSTQDRRTAKPSPATDANAPLSIVPSGGDSAPPAAAHPTHSAPAHPVPLATAAANANEATAPAPAPAIAPAPAPAAAGGGYAVQVSSQRSEAEAQDSFRALQAKYPDVLGGRQPIIRKADLGAKGVYYRALVGPFASAEEATGMCSNLKAAGGSCLVQKN